MTRYRKLIVALIGAFSTAAAQGLLTGTAAQLAACVIAALTAAGVYQVPNEAPTA